MASESDLQEETEEATPQRREDFRKQGQVAQTRELGSALSLLGMALVIYFMGRLFVEQFFDIYHTLYGRQLLMTVTSGNVLPPLIFALKKIFLLTFPVYVILFIMGLASSLGQIGFLFTNEPLTPNLNKRNPVEGLKRLFSLKALMEGIKAIFKFALVATVMYFILRSELPVIPRLLFSDSKTILLIS